MTRRTVAWIVLVPFLVLTAWAVAEDGLVGIFAHQTSRPAGWQVLVDLVIALVIVLSWLVPEARRAGRNPWPFVVATLLAGSIGPLLYLATAPASADGD